MADLSNETEKSKTVGVDTTVLRTYEAKSLEESLSQLDIARCEEPEPSHFDAEDPIRSCISALRQSVDTPGGTATSTFNPRCLYDGDKLGCGRVAVGVTVTTKTSFAVIDQTVFEEACPDVRPEALGVDFTSETIIIAKTSYHDSCAGGHFVAWPKTVTTQNGVAVIEAVPTADPVGGVSLTCLCKDRVVIFSSAILPDDGPVNSAVLELE